MKNFFQKEVSAPDMDVVPAKVLIVDDSATETHVLGNLLRKAGYEVLTARDGAEGVAVAQAQHPDLIVMDVVMPTMNGFQATRKLSGDEQTADIPIIIVSTKNQDTDRTWALRQGAREYLVKPVPSEALLRTIRELLSA